MPNYQIDGMKCEDVHEAIADAAKRARKGDGPTFLEIKTYRYRGHSMSDPAKYRTKEEVQKYKSIDPIEVVGKTMISKKWVTQADLDKMEDAINIEVNESVEFAEASPYPDASELYTDVYEEDYPFIVE